MADGLVATLQGRERKAFVVICQSRVSTKGLADILGVSTATAARVVAALRRKGLPIASVREGSHWHYEVRNREDLARLRWKSSRLRQLAGCATDWHEYPGLSEDEIICGRG